MRNILFLVLLLITKVVSAQNVKITWGQLSNDELQFKKIISVSDRIIKLSLKKEGKSKKAILLPILTSYDDKLNEIKSVTLQGKGDQHYISLFKLGSNLYAFIRELTNDDPEYIYSAQRIDPVSLQPSGDPIIIGTFYYPERDILLKDFFTYSADSTKILFKGYQEKKAKVCVPAPCKYPPLTVHIFDERMNRLLVKKIDEVPDTYINTIHASNNGDLVIYYAEHGAKKVVTKSFIAIYSPDGSKKEIKIPESDMYLQEFKFLSQKGSELSLFGQFRNAPFSWAAGIFTATIDITKNEFTINNAFPFDKTLLESLANDDLANKNNTIAAFFKPGEIVKGTDGAMFYTLEHRELPMLDHPSSTFWNWNWFDIISLRVDANGSTSFTRIPKFQQTWVDHLSSVGTISVPYYNQAIFFYMDRSKNIERDPLTSSSYKKGNFKNLSLVMASVDMNGKLTRKLVVEEFDKGFSPSMIYSYAVSNNKIILIGQTSQDPQEASKEVIGILEIK